jgi:Tfp pilus assembly protein PilO
VVIGGKKIGPVAELAISAGVLLIAVFAWYLALYSPVTAQTADIDKLIATRKDSVAAILRYRIEEAAFQTKIDQLTQEREVWDKRFPPRTQIVVIAKQILDFAEKENLDLIEMKPSLYELYALERSGATTAGRYVMQLPLNVRFEGRYLDLGRMLEKVYSLPFNVTISDMNIESIPARYPLLDIRLRMFIYVQI